MQVHLQLERASGTSLLQLDVDIREEGVEQDVCLPVSCQDGQLARPVMLRATATAGSNLDVVVSPKRLASNLESSQQDSSKCFGEIDTPADVSITCKEKPSG